jgi:23S rRNA (uracil1939-C5)-methyltransferase
VPVRIARIAAGGDGVGSLPDGRTVFVPRTAPGDLVELSGIREHKRFARARLKQLLEPSPTRVEPRCPHYIRDDCGGCQLQHLDQETQLASRRALVGDALRRIGKRDVADPPIVASDRTFDYRTKLTLHVRLEGRVIGLHRYDRPDQVFDLEWCHITNPELMALWQALRQCRHLLPSRMAHVVLRLDRQGGRHLLIRAESSEVWSGAQRLWRELSRLDHSATIWWQPLSGVARAMAGADVTYPATAFEQVHPDMGDRVRTFALDQLGELSGRHVWDLYSGIGETTDELVKRGAVVESVELDRKAVAEAEAKGPPARRHAGRVEDLISKLRRADMVIANPPRSGMDQRVTAELERIRPERLVYISCDPATLARDIRRLEHFALTRVQAFDLFPQTAHVETVAVLEPM